MRALHLVDRSEALVSTDVVAAVGGGAGKIGRYFTVVSALPAAVFVSYMYLLLQTGALTGPVRWSALAQFHPEHLVVLGIAALVLALALNPLQFTLIQLVEGYWGTSALARELMVVRTMHHRRRRQKLSARQSAATMAVADLKQLQLSNQVLEIERLRQVIIAAEAQRLRGSYPEGPDEVLPTRLGNVLRRYETGAGRRYGVDPLVAVPRLAMVADDRELSYVENQRVQLELAIRTASLAFAASIITVLVMSRHGLWIGLALAPYAVACLTYRGAVAVAHEYGTSLAVLIDLSRFALYDRMRIPSPPDSAVETLDNAALMNVFRFAGGPPLRYTRSSSSQGTGTEHPGNDGGERPEPDEEATEPG